MNEHINTDVKEMYAEDVQFFVENQILAVENKLGFIQLISRLEKHTFISLPARQFHNTFVIVPNSKIQNAQLNAINAIHSMLQKNGKTEQY